MRLPSAQRPSSHQGPVASRASRWDDRALQAQVGTVPGLLRYLGSTAGNRAVSQLIHSIQPVADARGRSTVQRNIGFEFEHTGMHIRQVPDAEKLAAKTGEGMLSPQEWPEVAPAPLERQKRVHEFDHGATVEADATLGEGKEDVEIVAPRRKPFENGYPISDAGKQALSETMMNATSFAQTAAKYGAKAVATADAGYEKQKKQWEQDYSLDALLQDKELHRKAAAGKHQGLVSLKSRLKKEKENEQKQEKERRKLAKKAQKEKGVKSGSGGSGKDKEPPYSAPATAPAEIMPPNMSPVHHDLVNAGLIPDPPRRAGRIHYLTPMSHLGGQHDIVLENANAADSAWVVQVTAGVPLRRVPKELKELYAPGAGTAETVLNLLRGENGVPPCPELEGAVHFLSSYINGAISWEQNKTSTNYKELATLMARTDCASIFASIPPKSRDPIAAQPKLWVDAWTKALEGSIDKPFYSKMVKQKLEQTPFSRRQWLESMVGRLDGPKHVPGKDLLVAEDPKERGSMGALGNQFDPGVGGELLPIFEYRAVENWTASEWPNRSLEFFSRVAQNMT